MPEIILLRGIVFFAIVAVLGGWWIKNIGLDIFSKTRDYKKNVEDHCAQCKYKVDNCKICTNWSYIAHRFPGEAPVVIRGLKRTSNNTYKCRNFVYGERTPITNLQYKIVTAKEFEGILYNKGYHRADYDEQNRIVHELECNGYGVLDEHFSEEEGSFIKKVCKTVWEANGHKTVLDNKINEPIIMAIKEKRKEIEEEDNG